MKAIINTEDDVVIHDITIKAGADYQIDFRFLADDDSEIGNYGILIWGEILFLDDASSVAAEIWDADTSVWDVDGEVIFGSSNWNLTAQLREFPEAFDYFDFQFDLDSEGIHMRMPKEVTELITYIRGHYDVFITDSDGYRTKLIMGTARILPQVTRGFNV